jgi:hypothetical protein
MAQNVGINFNLWSILDKEKHTWTNFIDLHHNLRIVIKQDKKEYVLETLYPNVIAKNASDTYQSSYEKHTNDSPDVSSLMLVTMSS